MTGATLTIADIAYLDSRLRGSWTGLGANHTRSDLRRTGGGPS